MSPEEFLEVIEGSLLDLTEMGLVEPIGVREDGKLLWGLTERGRELAETADRRAG